MWAQRAVVETRRAYRTWFGTLTIEPQVHYVHLARARQIAARRALIWEELSSDEQFSRLQAQSGREVTLMLKRLRKATQSPFVYLMVAERHKSGLPHYHLLVHEVDATKPVRKSQLDAEWRIGFCKWRLVRELGEATYLCKYLSKSTAARVRASVRYGENDLDRSVSVVGQSNVENAARQAPAFETGRPKTLLTDGPLENTVAKSDSRFLEAVH